MSDKLLGISQSKVSDYNNPNQIIIEDFTFYENYPFHWHEHYELEYIVKGKGTHIVNGKSYPMVPGSLHFLVPTDFHELKIEEPLQVHKIIFDENVVDAAIFSALTGTAMVSDQRLTGEDKALFDTLFALCVNQSKLLEGSAHYHKALKNLVENILLNVLECCKRNHLTHRDNADVNTHMGQVLVYIHRNFRKPITLKSVAAYAHFSDTYFSKTFHKTFGITFKEYVISLRMKFAEKLLVNTDCSITEVCYESGFGSLSNFVTEFRHTYSLSPSAYRKKYRHER